MQMTDDLMEAAARAMCVEGGFDPDETMPNDGPRWRYYIPEARAALTAALASRPSQGGEWVMVPREPTPEMTHAALNRSRQQNWPELPTGKELLPKSYELWAASEVYRAMLSASPSPDITRKATLIHEAATVIQTLQRERDEAKGKLALIVDRIVYSDSYGVPGSDFQCCHLCTGGGAPGVPFEHDERCPIRRVDRDYDQWFEDIRTTEDALRETEDRLTAAEQQVRDMGEGLEPFAEFAKVRDDNDPDMPDRMVVAAYATDLRGNAVRITLGDLRRARLLLKEGGE